MELDKKIKSNYKIFICFDTEKAKKYIGTQGYFTNDMSYFHNLDDCYKGTLSVVDNNSSRPYLNADVSRYFESFLPEEFVKQKEVKKKYRPFTIDEFNEQGFQTITFRGKETGTEYYVSYIGCRKPLKGNCVVILGNLSYSLNDLFENYEYLDSDNVWKPFGVEE